MAIQNRRGAYTDFDPSKMVEGEWAVVKSGDPNSLRGRSVYIAYEAGSVERMATYEDMASNIDQATASIQNTLTQNVGAAITNANNAASAATTAASGANSAASDANDAADRATSATSNVTAAIASANAARDSANQAAQSANTAATNANAVATQAEADVESAIGAAETATIAATSAATSATTAAGEATTAAEEATTASATAIASGNTALEEAEQARALAEAARNIIAEGAGVGSFNGRTGIITSQLGDYDADMIYYDANNSVTVSDQFATVIQGLNTATNNISSLTTSAMRQRGNIPTGTDLNNILDVGIYVLVGSYTYANAPELPAGIDLYGVLEVFRGAPGSAFKIQRISTSQGRVFQREFFSSSWLAWHRIDHVPSSTYLQLSGITLYLTRVGNLVYWRVNGTASAELKTGGAYVSFGSCPTGYAPNSVYIQYLPVASKIYQFAFSSTAGMRMGYSIYPNGSGSGTAVDTPSGTAIYANGVYFCSQMPY